MLHIYAAYDFGMYSRKWLMCSRLYKNITYCFSGVLNFLIKQLVGAMSLNPWIFIRLSFEFYLIISVWWLWPIVHSNAKRALERKTCPSLFSVEFLDWNALTITTLVVYQQRFTKKELLARLVYWPRPWMNRL